MIKKMLSFFVFTFLFTGCVVDRINPTDYSDAKPVYFDISIDNQSASDKEVIFERIKDNKSDVSMNDKLESPMNEIIVYKNIVCIDNRWEEEFRQFPTGMGGKVTIRLAVDDKFEEVGLFEVCCFGTNPKPVSYGEFFINRDQLKGIRSGVVKLKLTIADNNDLTLEYL